MDGCLATSTLSLVDPACFINHIRRLSLSKCHSGQTRLFARGSFATSCTKVDSDPTLTGAGGGREPVRKTHEVCDGKRLAARLGVDRRGRERRLVGKHRQRVSKRLAPLR